MKLTKHGEERAVDRVGIPRRAVMKLADEALRLGFRPASYSGSFRRYLDKLGQEHRTTPVIHHGHIYIFGADTFITTFPVPSKYRGYKPRTQV